MQPLALLASLVLTTSPLGAPDPIAIGTLDAALARMGGRVALQAIDRVRMEVMTEWQRTTFGASAVPTVSSYELSTELRDYRAPAWRYSRRFFSPQGTVDVVDVVSDSMAAILIGGRWRPQNVAYVDEREEAFTFSPERVVVLARAAADARALADTTMNGVRYARVQATVGRFRPTLFFRRGDGLLALARFRAGQPYDFGLAPWGEMEVDMWYSGWRRVADGTLTLPMQLDVMRVGRPYKRTTTLSLRVNPAIPADSFAIADSLRIAFLAQSRKPMFDLPMDSARVVEGRFATFGVPGTPAGALKVGGAWLLIEAGTAPLSVERSAAFLQRSDAGVALGGALVTAATGAGGLAWLSQQQVPTWVAGAARAHATAVRRGWPAGGATPRDVAADRWLRVGRDSVRVELLDLPDYPATPVVYVPSLRWAYAWPAGTVQQELVHEFVKRRGWTVERVGSARTFTGTPLR